MLEHPAGPEEYALAAGHSPGVAAQASLPLHEDSRGSDLLR